MVSHDSRADHIRRNATENGLSWREDRHELADAPAWNVGRGEGIVWAVSMLRVVRAVEPRRAWRAPGVAGIVLVIAGCVATDTVGPSTAFPVTFEISNALLAPVSVTVDDTLVAILTEGRSLSVTVSSHSQWLRWTSAKPADPLGHPIPDDIGETQIAVGSITRVLAINNVIGDDTFITASVFNLTGGPTAIGVWNGTRVTCAGILPAATTNTAGFVQIGYYRLTPATEVRAYRDALACTGPYRSWGQTHLSRFASRSGLVQIIVDASP